MCFQCKNSAKYQYIIKVHDHMKTMALPPDQRSKKEVHTYIVCLERGLFLIFPMIYLCLQSGLLLNCIKTLVQQSYSVVLKTHD